MSPLLVNALLAIPLTATAANFYLDSSDLEGGFASTAAERLDRLLEHLETTKDGDLVLVGEAAGWQGARQSGVPFTSAAAVGLRGSKEPSATVVHEVLASLGMLDRALLWNAFPLHPHRLGDPRTNRPPTAAELDAGIAALRLAIDSRHVICVGRKAEASVKRILGHEVPGVDEAVASSRAIVVRHPSHGGATRFRSESTAAIRLWNLV
ncbi:MAG: uracil-DNA glycosylase [Candidatus Saccharibacteria bacterium]|nr:uracil-DNA glycosylase [Microbacteriaceae bacterium]